MIRNEAFLAKAEAEKPTLHITSHAPLAFAPAVLREGEALCLDFGNHFVGHLRLKLGYRGSHPDAPLWLRIQLAEREQELAESVETYHGWVSKGWVQTEQLHMDVLPAMLELPRRYAFRYVKLEVLAASSKYALAVEDALCLAESSADDQALLPYQTDDPFLARIDAVAVRTLHECMQQVFEDGPKRDRRLWLGDLRLQALACYQTYRDYALVRRCLYLFAGCTRDDGALAAAIFTEPEIEADDVEILDYALLFAPILWDYYEASGDRQTLEELWPTAWRQVELAGVRFDGQGLIRDSDQMGWCLLDWNLALNKQAGAQGVYLYCLKAAEKIAETLGDTASAVRIRRDYEEKKRAAREFLWDRESGLFCSGQGRQRSLASQVWMILGGVLEGEDARRLLHRLPQEDLVRPVTPYMMHHYVEAALLCGDQALALDILRTYWGGMVEAGADTFWELYDPQDPDASPYGGTIVNSYCHAWSCAPAYFLRKYFG